MCFAMRCPLSMSSLKEDCRMLNDVGSVLAIMIIKREHKAMIKEIWLCWWYRCRRVHIGPEVIEFTLVLLHLNLGKSSESETNWAKQRGKVSMFAKLKAYLWCWHVARLMLHEYIAFLVLFFFFFALAISKSDITDWFICRPISFKVKWLYHSL